MALDTTSITTFLRINGKSEQSSDEEIKQVLQQAHYSEEEIQTYLASRKQPVQSPTSVVSDSSTTSVMRGITPADPVKTESKPKNLASSVGITILSTMGGLALLAVIVVVGGIAYFMIPLYIATFSRTALSESCAGGGQLLVITDHGTNTLENYTNRYFLNYKNGFSNRRITTLMEEYDSLYGDHLPNPLPIHTNVTVHEFDTLTRNSFPESAETGGSVRPITLFFDPATYSRAEFETISSCLEQNHAKIEGYFEGHPEGAMHVPHFIGTAYIGEGPITDKIHEINHGGHFSLNNDALFYAPTVTGDFIEILDNGSIVFERKQENYVTQKYSKTYLTSIFDLLESGSFPWFDGTATTTLKNTSGPVYEHMSQEELDRLISSDNQIGLVKNEQGITLREYLKALVPQVKTF